LGERKKKVLRNESGQKMGNQQSDKEKSDEERGKKVEKGRGCAPNKKTVENSKWGWG